MENHRLVDIGTHVSISYETGIRHGCIRFTWQAPGIKLNLINS